METQQRRPLTDRELRAWLATGQTDRGIGEGLTFVASASAASKGKASWILRFRVNGRPREKVLGRYPELSLKGARDQARKDREEIERGVDVAATKQAVKARLTETRTVRELGQLWLARYVEPNYKNPGPIAAVFRNHIYPVIGALTPKDVQPMHVDQVLRRTVANGAPPKVMCWRRESCLGPIGKTSSRRSDRAGMGAAVDDGPPKRLTTQRLILAASFVAGIFRSSIAAAGVLGCEPHSCGALHQTRSHEDGLGYSKHGIQA